MFQRHGAAAAKKKLSAQSVDYRLPHTVVLSFTPSLPQHDTPEAMLITEQRYCVYIFIRHERKQQKYPPTARIGHSMSR